MSDTGSPLPHEQVRQWWARERALSGFGLSTLRKAILKDVGRVIKSGDFSPLLTAVEIGGRINPLTVAVDNQEHIGFSTVAFCDPCYQIGWPELPDSWQDTETKIFNQGIPNDNGSLKRFIGRRGFGLYFESLLNYIDPSAIGPLLDSAQQVVFGNDLFAGKWNVYCGSSLKTNDAILATMRNAGLHAVMTDAFKDGPGDSLVGIFQR